jgi:uncharacterized membrane protein YkvA (DUF1232 family)
VIWRVRLYGLKVKALAVWIGAHDPQVSLPVRVLGWSVAAYAFSPIDLIPDVIPVLGLVDDLLIVPLGIWLFVRLIPPALHARHLAAAEAMAAKPVSIIGAIIIAGVWLLAAIWLVSLFW